MFKLEDIPRFGWKDLIGRKVYITSAQDEHIELIVARDLKSDEVFILHQINHEEAPKK